MTEVALRIFSIKLLKITYQIAKLINGKNPRAKTEERKMANTSVIVIPEGKICDYIDGKFRNDTPEEYVRQTMFPIPIAFLYSAQPEKAIVLFLTSKRERLRMIKPRMFRPSLQNGKQRRGWRGKRQLSTSNCCNSQGRNCN